MQLHRMQEHTRGLERENVGLTTKLLQTEATAQRIIRENTDLTRRLTQIPAAPPREPAGAGVRNRALAELEAELMRGRPYSSPSSASTASDTAGRHSHHGHDDSFCDVCGKQI